MTDDAARPFAQNVCGTVHVDLPELSADAVLAAISRLEKLTDAREMLGPLAE